MSIYRENGYRSRIDYLECLAEDYGVDFHQVVLLAETLGETEDFDGLVNSIEDLTGGYL